MGAAKDVLTSLAANDNHQKIELWLYLFKLDYP